MRKEKQEARREKVFRYITEYYQEHGYAPAIRDICEAVDISSTSVAFEDLRFLCDNGKISVSSGKNRAIVVTDKAERIRYLSKAVTEHCSQEKCCDCPKLEKGKCTLIEALQKCFEK